MTRRPAAAVALALALGATPAPADVTDAERQALRDTVARFDTAMETLDPAGLQAVLPPKILAFIADQAGGTPEQVLDGMAEAMRKALARVTFADFEMTTDPLDFQETATGVDYTLLPTRFVMETPDTGKLRIANETLALLDGGAWYLVRVSDPQQVAILRAVYPGFEDVAFSRGTVEPVE